MQGLTLCSFRPSYYKARYVYASCMQDVLDSMLDIGGYSIGSWSLTVIIEGDERHKAEMVALAANLDTSKVLGTTVPNAWKHRAYAVQQKNELPERITKMVAFITDHYVHTPVTVEGYDKIAYTENAVKGMWDKRTVCTFGRYLTKYNDVYKLTPERIEELVTIYKQERMPDSTPYTLHFTTEKDKIRQIFETEMYADGNYDTPSCMYRKFTKWDNRPYDVYADSPNVKVAYLTRADDQSTLLARSVCCNKNYVRGYSVRPSEDTAKMQKRFYEKLRELLSNGGYEEGSLEGAILQHVENNGSVLMPYLDGDADYVNNVDGQWTVTEDVGLSATSQRGILIAASALSADEDDEDAPEDHEDQTQCEICSDWVENDDIHYVEEESEYVCEHCLETRFVSAIYSRSGRTEYVRESNAVEDCNGEFYTSHYASNNLMQDNDGNYHADNCGHFAHCHACDENMLTADMTQIEDEDGQEHWFCDGACAYDEKERIAEVERELERERENALTADKQPTGKHYEHANQNKLFA